MAEVDGRVIYRARLNAYTVLVLLMLGLGSISYGYNASIIGTTLGQPSFIKYMRLDVLPNGTDLESTTNGLFQTGGVIGTLTLPWIADRWGRRWGCASACILLVVSGAIMTGSTNIGVFIAFRFFSGAGAFMILAAVRTSLEGLFD